MLPGRPITGPPAVYGIILSGKAPVPKGMAPFIIFIPIRFAPWIIGHCMFIR